MEGTGTIVHHAGESIVCELSPCLASELGEADVPGFCHEIKKFSQEEVHPRGRFMGVQHLGSGNDQSKQPERRMRLVWLHDAPQLAACMFSRAKNHFRLVAAPDTQEPGLAAAIPCETLI